MCVLNQILKKKYIENNLKIDMKVKFKNSYFSIGFDLLGKPIGL